MKFYSKITNRPNSVIKQVKAGLKVVENKRICVFHNGEYETDDPKIIEILQEHPNQFRTDHPWKPTEKPLGKKTNFELLKYQDLLVRAKEVGIKSKKKKEIIEFLNKKEVILNA